MCSESNHLIQRLLHGDAAAGSEIIQLADSTVSPRVMVAAAVLADRPTLLVGAALNATTTRERQLVTIAATYFERNPLRLNGLVGDHLADHPDDALATWIAHHPPYAPTTTTS